MSASNFKLSLSLVLAHEGGFVDHPRDPGGPTNRGVTQRVYDAYRRLHGLAVRSVKHISDDEVSEIYKSQYWKLVRGDTLPSGVDYAVFDFAVNSGVSRAVRYLQQLVGVNDDGIIGAFTEHAVNTLARANEEKLIADYCSKRLAFLKQLKTFGTFGRGWTRRVIGYVPGAQQKDSGVLDYAIQMARKDTAFVMPASIGAYEGEFAGKALRR